MALARAKFTRAQRIRKRSDFVRIQEGGARVTTRHLLILLAARINDGDGGAGGSGSPARLGVVASRKVGGAVQRNRAKRLVREAFRQHPDLFPPQIDAVVIVRPGTHELRCAEVSAELTSVASLIRKRAASVLSSPLIKPG